MEKKPFQDHFFTRVGNVTEMLDALDHIHGSMFMVKNLESRYVYMSRALREAIQLLPHEEVVGKTDFDLFPRMIAETFRQNDLLVFEEGRTLLNEIHATAFFSGPTKWFFSSKFPLRDSKDEIVGLITINEPYEKVMGQDDNLNQLLPAIQYVTREYAEKITIADLAELCSLSESHFMRIFKQRMNMTAQTFVEQVRMYHAIDAIRHGTDSIASIAHGCGFYDHSAFVKRFRKLTGLTPLKYRKQYQSQFAGNRTVAVPEPT